MLLHYSEEKHVRGGTPRRVKKKGGLTGEDYRGGEGAERGKKKKDSAMSILIKGKP